MVTSNCTCGRYRIEPAIDSWPPPSCPERLEIWTRSLSRLRDPFTFSRPSGKRAVARPNSRNRTRPCRDGLFREPSARASKEITPELLRSGSIIRTRSALTSPCAFMFKADVPLSGILPCKRRMVLEPRSSEGRRVTMECA